MLLNKLMVATGSKTVWEFFKIIKFIVLSSVDNDYHSNSNFIIGLVQFSVYKPLIGHFLD